MTKNYAHSLFNPLTSGLGCVRWYRADDAVVNASIYVEQLNDKSNNVALTSLDAHNARRWSFVETTTPAGYINGLYVPFRCPYAGGIASIPTGAANRTFVTVSGFYETTASADNIVYGYGTNSSGLLYALRYNPHYQSMYNTSVTSTALASTSSIDVTVRAYNGTSDLLYVNGVLSSTHTQTLNTNASNNLQIGGYALNGSNGGGFVFYEFAAFNTYFDADAVANVTNTLRSFYQ